MMRHLDRQRTTSTMTITLSSARVLARVAVLTVMSAAVCAAQQPAPDAARAEAVYKNITVLGGVAADQVTPIMRLIARDLGVTCEYCHDEKDRAKDGLAPKDTARQMITMMRDINARAFGGRTVVTCVTCHNGRSTPANVPTLPPFSVAVLGPGDEVRPPALPAVDEVLARYLQALGGEQALRRITTLVATGTRQNYTPAASAVPAPFAIERYARSPNLSLTVARQPTGPVTTGFDGATAWSQDARGRVTAIAGTAASRARRDADIYPALNLTRQYERVAVQGVEKIGTRDAYVVVAVPRGESPEQFYFDVASGLLVRHQRISTTALGEAPLATEIGRAHV